MCLRAINYFPPPKDLVYAWKVFKISSYPKTKDRLTSCWKFVDETLFGCDENPYYPPQNLYAQNRWNEAKYKTTTRGIHCYLTREDALRSDYFQYTSDRFVLRKVKIGKVLATGYIHSDTKAIVTDRIFIFDKKRSEVTI